MPPETASSSRASVVLVAHEVGDYGGMERAFAELIRNAHREVSFHVVARELQEDLRPLASFEAIRVPARPFPLKFMSFYIRAGARIRGMHAANVHTLGAIVPNRAALATIQFCHAGFRHEDRSASAGGGRLASVNAKLTSVLSVLAERWSYRPGRLSRYAAVSAGTAREVVAAYPDIPVTLTPNGVDTERFRPDPSARSVLRRETGTDQRATVAVFVGGDWARKGLHLAIEAVGQARACGHSVVLWVVGRGDEAAYAKLADQHGARGAVRFFGVRADTERLYAAADVFLFPSAYEAFPLVALEAAASGLALITTDVNGIADLVGNEPAGIVVRRDVRSIADALARLASNAQLRTAMGAAARAQAELFTWERSARAVLEAYDLVLHEPRALDAERT